MIHEPSKFHDKDLCKFDLWKFINPELVPLIVPFQMVRLGANQNPLDSPEF